MSILTSVFKELAFAFTIEFTLLGIMKALILVKHLSAAGFKSLINTY